MALLGIGFVLKLSSMMEYYIKNSSWEKSFLGLSSASYIIYLLHTTFEGGSKALILKLPYISNLSNDFMFTVGALIVVLTGVIVPVLLYKYVLVKSRIMKVLFGLK